MVKIKKLTCVTAVFNAISSGNKENLIRCIESVDALRTEHEHLIYDAVSTDGTVELLKELEKRTLDLKVISEKDTGIYNALNKGARDAQGEWYYVLGCDDYLCSPEVMDKLLNQVSEKVDEIIAPVKREKGCNPFFREIKDLSKIFWIVPYSHQGMIIRTKYVREFGGFDESYKICADWDMMNKVHQKCLNIQYTFEPFAFYASGGLSENSSLGWIEMTKVIQKNLGMTDEQTQYYRKVGFPPLWKVVPYIFYDDLAYRLGAREMAWKYIQHYFFRLQSMAYWPVKKLLRK